MPTAEQIRKFLGSEVSPDAPVYELAALPEPFRTREMNMVMYPISLLVGNSLEVLAGRPHYYLIVNDDDGVLRGMVAAIAKNSLKSVVGVPELQPRTGGGYEDFVVRKRRYVVGDRVA